MGKTETSFALISISLVIKAHMRWRSLPHLPWAGTELLSELISFINLPLVPTSILYRFLSLFYRSKN